MACERITAAITRSMSDTRPIKAVLDPYNPTGSTAHVKFNTSRGDRWPTDARGCHVNWVILDSDWEAEFWRQTLDHFDAIKIGLTATPAAHTTAYFKDVVYRYEYERAVREGYLVDYDVVAVKSNVRMQGIFLKEGETVGIVNPETGASSLDSVEDERQFDATEVEHKITSPDSNRKILEEIKRHAEDHEQHYGRFPKTLIFAANDLPHTSHADQLVNTARDIFGRGDSFVQKITGSPTVDRPLQRIREFRNRPQPGIVVTVDMLSTRDYVRRFHCRLSARQAL